MKRWFAMATAVTLLGAAACGKDKPPAPAAGSASVTTAAQSAKVPGRGLAHSGNDKELVKLAEAALGCTWQGGSFKSDCGAYQAFIKADAVKTGKGDATFLNMLEDDRKEVRWLAARGLDHGMNAPWHKDAGAAKRVLAAARAEKEEKIGYALGRLVGMLNLKETGAVDEVKKLLAETKSVEVRRGVLSNVLFNNRDEGGFYELIAEMARKHEDRAIRVAAAKAFWIGGGGRKDETCKLWLELTADKEDELAGLSAYHCAWWQSGGGCVDQWDGLLDSIDKRAGEGTVNTTFMTSSLSWLRKQKKASADQKKRAMGIVKKIAENEKNNKMARADALRVIHAEDPKGKAFLKKFKEDKDIFVKSTANRLLAKKEDKGAKRGAGDKGAKTSRNKK